MAISLIGGRTTVVVVEQHACTAFLHELIVGRMENYVVHGIQTERVSMGLFVLVRISLVLRWRVRCGSQRVAMFRISTESTEDVRNCPTHGGSTHLTLDRKQSDTRYGGLACKSRTHAPCERLGWTDCSGLRAARVSNGVMTMNAR